MSFIAFTSCKKELNRFENEFQSSETYQSKTTIPDVPISTFIYTDRNGKQQQMLVFKNSDDFFKQLDILEELDEQHEQDFLNKHPNATEEEINRLDSIEQFDEYKVYKDFNYRYNFESQIFNYIEAEITWLNDPNLSSSLDPDLLFYGLDENELSILNADWAFMYENENLRQIVKYYSDAIVLIKDGDINSLNQISGYSSIKDVPQERLRNCERFDLGDYTVSCVSANRESDYRTIGRNRRLKGVVKVKKYQASSIDYNGNGVIEPGELIVITRNKVKAKCKTIKKRWWGGWWRYRVSQIKAAIDGEAHVNDCMDPNMIVFDKEINFKEEHNRAKAKYKKVFPDPSMGVNLYGLYMEDDRVWGYFYSHNRKRFILDFYNGTFHGY